MTPTVIEDASAHALAEYPRESCGVILATEAGLEYVACRNLSASPNEHFRLSPTDWEAAEARGEIVGVVHSHPDVAARPSEGDLVACEATQLPWWLVGVRKDPGEAPVVTEVYSWEPTGYEAPLVGRAFHYGVLDCWALVRDYYARVKGIELPAFDHGPDGWWQDRDPENTFSPYEDPANMEAAGFVRIDGKPTKEGDVIVMQVRSASTKPNHVGVLLDPNRGTMLHHLYGQLSDRVVYGGYWQEVTRYILRHKSNV